MLDSNEKITFDDFKKIEMIVGEIKEVERVPDTDKLLRLIVDLGLKPSISTDGSSLGAGTLGKPEQSQAGLVEERDIRQIVSGIATFFPEYEKLQGKKCVFVGNLAPRTIRGLESNGMILAAHTEDNTFALMVPENDVPSGTRIG